MPFVVAGTTIPVVGSDRALPGAPHLLHRAQLRGACARDGVRPDARAAVLLPEADRRGAGRDARHGRRPPVSAADQELPLRSRARRRARRAGATSPSRRRSTSSTATRVGPRHDAARPAARDGRREEAVGDRQELRPLGAARAAAPVADIGHFTKGRISLAVNGAVEAERRPQPDDLVGRRADQQALRGVRASGPATSSTRARRRTSGRSCAAT